MKKMNKYISVALIAVTAGLATGCSDEFLQDKKLYGSFNGTTIYENYVSADNRVGYLYACMLPNATGGSDQMTDMPSTGSSDQYSTCTEEYGGLSDLKNPLVELDYENTTDYFNIDNNYSPYVRIRECNDVIEGVSGSESLTENEKHLLLGQAYFFRAWRYYLLVKMYGGVPIVDKVQNPIIGDSEGRHLVVPRSTTKACVDFICKDLQTAADYLPARWDSNEKNFGRITSGAALALKGRVELLYASPLFNRTNNVARWETAYQTNKEAINRLKSGNFGLAYESNPGVNATGWAKMFSDYNGSDGSVSEAVLVTLYNNVSPVDHLNPEKWNGWEQAIRPANAGGSGGKTPTAEMVDLFPMADGKRPTDPNGTYTYNPELFFLNRDPRFYRTFAFPGVEWQFSSGDLADFGAKGQLAYGINGYTTGSGYKLWNYCWYETMDNRISETKSGYAADCLGTKNSGIYLRKRTDDLKVNSSPLYIFEKTAGNGFRQSAAPYMEIRFAEVLLNYAEAACGANHLDEAYTALTQIRGRVGYTAEKNFGLDPTIANDQARLFEAILYERQIELAYEGKRFEDVRRWMLFDGGVGQETLKSSWKLVGFGGNTCSYLGVTALNGQTCHRIEVYAKNFLAAKANNVYNEDKTIKTQYDELWNQRPAALNLTEVMTVDESGEDPVYANTRVKALADFYQENFKRKNLNTDTNDETVIPTYKIHCYIFGFKKNAMQNNVSLEQNIGWGDYWKGGADGTFDPLAE